MNILVLNIDYLEFLCWLYAQHQGLEKEGADLTKARPILGFEPKVSYKEGFKRTIDWYFTNKYKEEVKANMNKLLMER